MCGEAVTSSHWHAKLTEMSHSYQVYHHLCFSFFFFKSSHLVASSTSAPVSSCSHNRSRWKQNFLIFYFCFKFALNLVENLTLTLLALLSLSFSLSFSPVPLSVLGCGCEEVEQQSSSLVSGRCGGSTGCSCRACSHQSAQCKRHTFHYYTLTTDWLMDWWTYLTGEEERHRAVRVVR